MINLFAKIRFLTITIFATTLMLTVKVGDIWQGFDGLLNGSISVSEAQAQQGGAAKSGAAGQAATATTAKGEQAAGKQDTGKQAAPEQQQVSSLVTEDPTLLTQNEIDLLQKLAERRDSLDLREKEIDQRFGMLKAAESRIDKKVSELKLFQGTISKLIKTHNEQQDKKTNSLVKIYEAMKPKDAAKIFQELDMDTLLLLAERMKERKLAAIMAKVSAARATEITIELSRLRKLPSPGLGKGG